MKTLVEIRAEIAEAIVHYPVYVYVLHKPDGTPFYVGKGGYKRITEHEKEAKSERTWLGKNEFKTNTIQKIWREGGQVGYSIDSWHTTGESANQREIELIAHYGRRCKGEGSLTNITAGGEGMLDVPAEVRARIAAKLRQLYADNPHLREEISARNKQFCQDHPEFVESLQGKKDEWKEQNPEAYAAAERRRLEICGTEEVRKQVSETLKEMYKEHPELLEVLSERASQYFEENPEAVENARQNSINNRNCEYIIRWIAENPEGVRERNRKHSEFMKEWHATEEGKAMTKLVTAKRNAKVRTEEHRQHMAGKTAEYIKNNPEADKARREKVNEKSRERAAARQEFLLALRDYLVRMGKLKQPTSPRQVSNMQLTTWTRNGILPFTVPDGRTTPVEEWIELKERLI